MKRDAFLIELELQEILSWKHVAQLNEGNVWNFLWNYKYELVLLALAEDKKNNEIL